MFETYRRTDFHVIAFLQLSDSPTEISDAPFLQKQNY